MLRYLTFFVLLVFVANAYPQSNVEDPLLTAFEEYNAGIEEEHLVISIDRSFYVAGESVRFRAYLLNEDRTGFSSISGIIHLALLNQEKRVIQRGSHPVRNSNLSGELEVPENLPSGVYWLVGYTNYMRNFELQHASITPLTIINPVNSFSSIRGKDPSVEIYPEGGKILRGQSNNIVVRASADSALLMTSTGERVAAVNGFNQGFARFTFVPGSADYVLQTYSAGQPQSRVNLPPSETSGVLLRSVGEGQNIELEVSGSPSFYNRDLKVLYYHNSKLKKLTSFELDSESGTNLLQIERDSLPEGVIHFSVWFENSLLARRSVYNERDKKEISLSLSKQEFAGREQVSLGIDADSTFMGLNVWVLNDVIDNPWTLADQLNLYGYFPAIYRDLDNTGDMGLLDNVLVAHAPRLFAMDSWLLSTEYKPRFLVETRGVSLMGKAFDENGSPLQRKSLSISLPGKNPVLKFARTDLEGNFFFRELEVFTTNDLYIRPGSDNNGGSIRIDWIDHDLSMLELPDLAPASVSEYLQKYVDEWKVRQQIDTLFVSETTTRIEQDPVPDPFYGIPDRSVKMDDYVRFASMEDVMRELVHGVKLRRKGDSYSFRVLNVVYNRIAGRTDATYFKEDPLSTLNGVPVFDPNVIVEIDPDEMEKIDVVTKTFLLDGSVFDGVIAFYTRSGDYPYNDLTNITKTTVSNDWGIMTTGTGGLNQDPLSIPDFREFIFWDAAFTGNEETIRFDHSDLTGNYIIKVEGFSAGGGAVNAEISYRVTELRKSQ